MEEFVLSDLPDPSDRQAAWHDDEPAYLCWWRRLQAWAAEEPDAHLWGQINAHRLVGRYAQAIPTIEAVDALVGLGPLVEVGAGNGYWARLVVDRGGDIRAFDLEAPAGNGWTSHEAAWHPVELGDERVVVQHPERAIFVCWPPRPGGFVPRLLEIAPQATFALITDGPAPSGDRMYDRLREGWHLEREVDLPHWPARFDRLMIWRRR